MVFDLENSGDGVAYKLLTGLVAPRPIALVTSMNEDGGLNAAPFSAYNYLCTDPPIIAMGVNNRSKDGFVPKDTAGLEIIRPMKAFGEWDSPSGHGELEFHDVRVPIENIILGEGRGFEIAQGRLGPGRFQYAMTNVGMAQRCLELMCARAEERVAFGQKLSDQSSVRQDIARSRCEIEQVRLLVFKAAAEMDRSGAKGARDFISMVKIAGPKLAQDVAERAIQIFGAKGVGQDTPLPGMWALARIMRIADGPDAVHMSQLAKLTIRQLATPVPLNS